MLIYLDSCAKAYGLITGQYYINSARYFATYSDAVDRYGVLGRVNLSKFSPGTIVLPKQLDKIIFGMDIKRGDYSPGNARISVVDVNNNRLFCIGHLTDAPTTLGIYDASDNLVETKTWTDFAVNWRYLEFSFDTRTGAYVARLEQQVIFSGTLVPTDKADKIQFTSSGSGQAVIEGAHLYVLDDTGDINNSFLGVTRVDTVPLSTTINTGFIPSGSDTCKDALNDLRAVNQNQSPNTSTFIYNNHVCSAKFTYGGTLPGTGAIIGFQQFYWHRKEDVLPDPNLKIRQIIYGSGDTPVYDTQVTPTINYTERRFVVEKNPDTNLRYTRSEIATLGCGLALEA